MNPPLTPTNKAILPIGCNHGVAQRRRALFLPLRLSPFALQKVVAEQLLNLLLGQAIRDGDLDFLAGKTVAVHIADVDIEWLVGCRQQRLQWLPRSGQADARISVDSEALLWLVSGRADPDSLFFQRRLAIEGDTELGLAVKNTLDGLDPTALPGPVRALLGMA